MSKTPHCVTQILDALRASAFESALLMITTGARMPLQVIGSIGTESIPSPHELDARYLKTVMKSMAATLLSGEISAIPSAWKSAIKKGPIGLFPLAYADAGHMISTSESRFGLLAVFSSDVRIIAGEDLALVDAILASRIESLFLHACLRELKWYRQAHRSFSASTSRVLNHPIWRSVAAGEPNGAFERAAQLPSIDSSQSSPEVVRKVVADQIMPVLNKGMRLDRCAILTPMEDAPDFWYYLSHEGFPEHLMEEKNFYVRGQGLTGATLALKRGEQPVISDDVESDPRWSKSGKLLSRGRGEEGQMAFVGVPIFSHFSPDGDSAYGALVCCRFRSSASDPPKFTLTEMRHLEIIAAQLSYGFDIVRWRQSSQQRQQRQLMLSRIWTTKLSEQRKLTYALELLREEGPFRRILLSLVSPDRKYIRGKAASGFQASLVGDTVRAIYKNPPVKPADEDILALIVRERIKQPFPVDPNDQGDRFAAHIDKYTAGRHGVTNHLMLIPLIDSHTEVSGVLLAEFPEGARVVTPEQCERFVIYAQQLSILLQHHSLELATRSERDLFERLLSCVSNRRLEDAAAKEALLRDTMQCLCDVYGFSTGVAYLYEEDARLLRGKTGIGLDESAIKRTVYSVDLSAETAFDDVAFATHVLRSRQPVFLNALDSSPVDCRDRESVGVPAHHSGLGIPLVLGEDCYGVLILCGSSVSNPLAQSSREICEYGRLAAMAVALAQAKSSLKELERLQGLQDVCIRHVGRLSKEAAGEAQVLQLGPGGRESLEHFAKEAGQLLGAQMCAIFTPDMPIRIPSLAANEVKGRGWPSGIPFMLRAGHGYPGTLVDSPSYSYSDRTRGLTSTVIRTLVVQSSDDVERDKRWSGRLRGGAKESSSAGPSLRSWLGAPIIFNDSDGRHVYGALTFSRDREHPRDTGFFDERDRTVAERLAWLLAVGFHTRQSVGRMYDAMKGRLRSFLHAVRLPLDLVQRDRLGRIRAVSRNRGRPVELEALCDKLELDLRFINCGFAAFTDFTRDDAEWSDFTPIVDMQEVVKTVWHIASTISSQVKVHPPEMMLNGVQCRIDSARVTFILHALIENAIKAVRQHGGGDVWTQIEANGDKLRIVVRDNGCGIAGDIGLRIYDEGFSGFARKSSGIGLSLVKRFVDANDGGSIIHDSPDGSGARFTVVLNVL